MKLVLISPQSDSTADWPKQLMSAVPGLEVLRPTTEGAAEALRTADAAYGVLPAELLAETTRLRWLQAEQAGPPAGFYYPELVAHPLQVTNMRATYTDHVAEHTLAMVLALTRGLPRYIRDQQYLVISTVPHTPDTEGMVDTQLLKSFKPSSFFINVGRGPTVRLDALHAALTDGRLRAVALDVFETEPLPPDHPLWRRPEVLITPHVAGAGPHESERRYAVLLENCRRFTSGQNLINLVDKTKWF